MSGGGASSEHRGGAKSVHHSYRSDDRGSEGRWLAIGLPAARAVALGAEPTPAAVLPRDLPLLDTPLVEGGATSAGEVTVGAVEEMAGAGACNGVGVIGATDGAWVAAGMVNDHPG
jgi:hypothetical protein